MKAFLRTLSFVALFALSFAKLNAQCTVSDIVIQNIRGVVPGASTCTVTFDVSFNIQDNNGNKYIFFHVWTQAQYPDYFKCVNGQTTLNGAIKAPKATDLANSFLNVGIDNSGTTPTFIANYPPDGGVTLTSGATITKTVLADGSANVVITGLTATVPVACGTPTVLIADLWSSQSAQAQVAHCVNCGIRYSAGFLTAIGLVNCSSLQYNVTVTNRTPGAITGTYSVYADVNGDTYLTPATDTALATDVNFSIGAGVGTIANISGPVPAANLNQGIFVVFTQTSGAATGASRVVYVPSTFCSTLPVSFASFTAKRMNSSNVTLRWETANEISNRGFAVQKYNGRTWETVAFVGSQAIDGNSSSLLTYTYNDINASRDISQYRIQQVDLDGKAKMSEVRTVRGDGQTMSTLVYPNPSRDGSVRVVFDDAQGTRNAVLADINGRIIKQWTVSTGNTIQIDNLKPGVYTLRIVMAETRQQVVEKIVVTGGN